MSKTGRLNPHREVHRAVARKWRDSEYGRGQDSEDEPPRSMRRIRRLRSRHFGPSANRS